MRNSPFPTLLTTAALLAAGLTTGTASAGIVVYSQDAAGFAAATAAGAPPVHIGFDSIAPGTDITGTVIDDVRFVGTGAPLIVVRGADTFTPDAVFSGTVDINTNRLPATSGENVLSPGGTRLGPGDNPAEESDWLTLEFLAPVRSLGFDHLSQSADGVGFTWIQVYDPDGALLYEGLIPISNLGGGGAPGGADFWGVVATGSTAIGTVEIFEFDSNNRYPDANIGFDSFQYQSIPEPGSLVLAGAGLVALGLARRHKRSA